MVSRVETGGCKLWVNGMQPPVQPHRDPPGPDVRSAQRSRPYPPRRRTSPRTIAEWYSVMSPECRVGGVSLLGVRLVTWTATSTVINWSVGV
jgi:hypothetical protein